MTDHRNQEQLSASKIRLKVVTWPEKNHLHH